MMYPVPPPPPPPHTHKCVNVMLIASTCLPLCTIIQTGGQRTDSTDPTFQITDHANSTLHTFSEYYILVNLVIHEFEFHKFNR